MRVFLFLISATSCAAIGWLIYQDSLASGETTPKPPKAEVVAVEATPVLQRTVEDRIELVGGLEPITQVAIRSRVSGYLTRLPADIGDEVKANDVVAELDDKATRELFVRAQAAEGVAQAQLDAQKSREAQARRQVERFRELGKTGVSTEQQLEDAESAWTVAQAELELEKARLKQANADLERSRLNLEELSIQSPVSGFVAERNADVGDLARAEDILLRIVDLNTVRTVVNVVERDYGKVEVGQAATIRVDAVADRAFPGVVISKAPVLDPETRTGRVMIRIDNPDRVLRPGMHARVIVVAEQSRPDSLAIPVSALLEQGAEQYVFTVDEEESVARRSVIKTGIHDGQFIEVLEGLDSNSKVITLGSRLVSDGAQLEATIAPLAALSEMDAADVRTAQAAGR